MSSVIVQEAIGITQINGNGPHGAMCVYAHRLREGDTVVVRRILEIGDDSDGPEYYATVTKYEREKHDPRYVARFPVLLPGHYEVFKPNEVLSSWSRGKKVTVFPGNTSDVTFT